MRTGVRRVEVELPSGPSLTHLGYALTGLVALARAGRLELSVGSAVPDAHPLVLRCRIDDGRGGDRLLALDMLDHGSEWDVAALDRADLYLKRSFHRPDVDRLGTARASRVEPFGMSFLCRSAASTAWLLRHALLPELGALVRGRWLPGRLGEYRDLLASPTVAGFEVPPEVKAPSRVAFQTRVWTAEELGPESDALNEERVATVRALRHAFGARFEGGLVPTPLARARWPEEISRAPTRRAEHLRWMHGALVAVYTRGLHHSTAFKLPEYLAASRCVVAEPVRNALPRPLVPGRDLVEFHTPEECVARCDEVLGSRELQDRLRRGAWEYWRSEGRPDVRMERCLDRLGAGARGLPSRDPGLSRRAPP